ncbi:hypothetical protein SS50377_21009 [Spironucleus salmonicida]|uniref:Uncharacterized protein n=1 Tax=Spironucleus salmonicida TaxID=348837 RepID=V6LJ22_9EUKA|nr:hypothetical protein SS50377_21009 [Spironucleus salmonicida]|eukprot:EST43676.1 Hypothetical protein SS50377_16720 [Spironucleus salmonicida]
MRGIPVSLVKPKLPKYVSAKPKQTFESDYQSYQQIVVRSWQNQLHELLEKKSKFDKPAEKQICWHSNQFFSNIKETNSFQLKRTFYYINIAVNCQKPSIQVIIQRTHRFLVLKPPIKQVFTPQTDVLRSFDSILCASAVEKIQSIYIGLLKADATFMQYISSLYQYNYLVDRNQLYNFLSSFKQSYNVLTKHLEECILDIKIYERLKLIV